MLRTIRSSHRLLVFSLLLITVSARAQSSADTERRVNDMLGKLTLDEKIALIGGVDDFYVRNIDKIGLPRLKMADGPIGVRNYGPSTVFGGIGLAATWDREMARRVGEFIGRDARARGVHFMLGPGVNIYRSPLNGRNFEYFGEDPFLASRTAVSYINGMQAQGVSATIKHFMGNNSEFDRHNTDSIIDERTMREIYLPVFEAAVKEAHVGSIMDSYNLVNGEHMSQNAKMNIDLAKKDWGFDGIMMSDWTSTYDGVACANGGLDLEMPRADFMNRETLLPAIKSGKVSEATIDDKVRRILRTAARFGWLDRQQTDPALSLYDEQGDKTALDAARESMVLLKNDSNTLPLDAGSIHTIAVIGPDAHPARTGGGGSAEARPFQATSYLDGVAQYLKGKNAQVLYDAGLPSLSDLSDQTQFATEASGGRKGLNAEIFDNAELSGKPVASAIHEHVHFEPARSGGPDMPVSVRWKGFYRAPKAGRYLAMLQGPGGSGGYRLYVDQKLVIDDWTQAYAFLSQRYLDLTQGPHEIQIDYRTDGGWGKVECNFAIVQPETIVREEAKRLAKSADVVVLAVGFEENNEGEDGDREFMLPPGQNELIEQIASLNPHTVVVVTSGGGVDMSAWHDKVPAILEAWYAGQEGGAALAQVLFGEFDPSGRLPISIEKSWSDNPVHDHYYPAQGSKKVEYKEGVFVGYRYYDKSETKPLFPFGAGLSYTQFAYRNLKVSEPTAQGDVTVSFDVSNVGKRAGASVAELYVGEENPSVPRPKKELKGFERVTLAPGETKNVSIKLDRRSFAFYDVKTHQWAVDKASFNILVGQSSVDVPLAGKVQMH